MGICSRQTHFPRTVAILSVDFLPVSANCAYGDEFSLRTKLATVLLRLCILPCKLNLW